MLTGKRVKIKAKGRVFEGTVMPSFTENFVLKLENGYNVGFTEYELIEILEDVEKAPIKKEIRKKDGLPEVKIISTGGTIASRIDYRTGAVTSQFTAEEIISDVPEIADICNISTELLYNILSENMKPYYWIELARRIYEALKSHEGVIVTHGTDTMHYSSSAVSFMISTPKPIIFVGSQRSSDRPSSDAVINLLCSAKLSVSDVGEVLVCMHGTTNDDFCYAHRGVKVRKMHTSRRDAFQSINTKPVAKINYPSLEIEWLSWRFRRDERELSLRDKLEEKVVLIKFFPGLSPEIIEFFYSKGYRGFVIEGTGLGHVSTDWIETLKKICGDSIVVMTSQCLNGKVCNRVYDTGRDLLNAGVIEGGDMLPETALVKLMFLLGNYKFEIAKELLKVNMVGEIESRSMY
ncbi:MAG: Glu-tRNA(Gln) amidotransferase subunit GatD [Archaeoglobaceae archaeon]|nr:Glu-tRNA(Gln) amidotransferase subunit GatD [Archaeoglobaceae archaeon]MDW7989669.1 Glu-tRNA(Gln) amidotransferase subunit GatD [Archaeoglobaceae archaeon]